MLTLRIGIVASLSLLASGVARAATDSAPTPVPALTFTGAKFPPPGLAADQALLGQLLSTHADMLAERSFALRALQRLGDERLEVRLEEAARAAPPDERPRLEALHAQLVEAWGRCKDLLVTPWPVDPRMGCRERAVAFETLMSTGTAGPSPRLDAAREDARRCLAKETVPVSRLRAANAALREIVPQARAALGDPSPGAAPNAAAAGGAAPQTVPATAPRG